MRTAKSLVCVAAVLLLSISVASADVTWTFTASPSVGVAPPGGTMQWNYHITNSPSSTEALIPLIPGVSFEYPGIESSYVADQGIDVNPLLDIGPIPPGGSASGPLYHLTWAPTAPVGYSVRGGLFLVIANSPAVPGQGVVMPFAASVGTGAEEFPSADAGPDLTVELTSLAGAQVTLDGSGSSAASTYKWREGGNVLGTDPIVTVTLPLGAHNIALDVAGVSGGKDSDEAVVTVQDTTAPEMTLTVYEHALWPPNHKMVLAAEVSGVSDLGDSSPLVDINVTSNEAINGPGDGNTDTDWLVIEDEESGVWEIWLCAERNARGSGREYTINVVVSDLSGNQNTASATVGVVPHDMGKGK